jgi:hypothetical protein
VGTGEPSAVGRLEDEGTSGGNEFLKWWAFDAYVQEFRSGDTIDLTEHETSIDAG